MDFATCAHGNISMTCPQCRGRQPAAPAFGSPAAQPGLPKLGGHDDEHKTVDLNIVVDKIVDRVERSSNQSSDRRFWPRGE